MMWPPSVLRIRLAEGRKKGVNLWLPVFLLWPFLAVILLFMPLAMTIGLFLPRRSAARVVLLGSPRILAVVCALRGLEVRVEDSEDRVLVIVR